jgi:hypothetical protein
MSILPLSLCGPPPTLFLTSKISYLLFANPMHKSEMGTAKRERLIIRTHLDHLGNQQQVLGFFMSAFCQSAKLQGQNYFVEPNWHVLSFFHRKFSV